MTPQPGFWSTILSYRKCYGTRVWTFTSSLYAQPFFFFLLLTGSDVLCEAASGHPFDANVCPWSPRWGGCATKFISPFFVLRKWLHVHEPVGDCFCSEGELGFAVLLTLNPSFWHHTRDILACLSCALHPPSSRGAESIRTEVQSGDLIVVMDRRGHSNLTPLVSFAAGDRHPC